ncbi:MAG: LamG domain-containing protein, partial [Planctomycetes bacterium]|nr:LamG domain-containing protein [Planctomycetota bacterium]
PESDFNQDVNYYLGLGRYYGIALYNTLFVDNPEFEISDLSQLSSHWLEDNKTTAPIGELAGRWKLDEIEGAWAMDITGISFDGELHNGAAWRSDGGKFDGGLSFDEIDDYITIGDFDYCDANDEFSVSFWFKIGDVAGDNYQYAFSHGSVGTNNSLNIYFRESGQSEAGKLTTNIQLSNGYRWYHTNGSVVADGEWHMYTLTLSASEGGRVYIDGHSVGADTNLTGSSFDPATEIYLGGREDLNANRFYGNTDIDDGLMDEVRLYSSCL